METNYHILHLVNGQTLVGDLEYTVEAIMLKFPIEVTSITITDEEGKVMGEHMVLRPFLIMTDDRELLIDQFNVLCCVTLSERLYKSYEDMVEHVYSKKVSFDGDFYSGEKKEKEKDIEDAITRFQDFAALFPEDPKAPDYLLRASDLALISDQPQKSVKLLNRIINDYPDYPKMEDVKYNRASHLDFELRDTTKAKEAYQEFIDTYPNSPLINDCKSRIENIQYSLEELTEKFMNELEESGAENELP